MKKSRTGSPAGEALVSPPVATVQVPLPLLDVLADTRTAFFGLCLEAGEQVLRTMMEQDRERLCGPEGRPRSRPPRVPPARGRRSYLGGRRSSCRACAPGVSTATSSSFDPVVAAYLTREHPEEQVGRDDASNRTLGGPAALSHRLAAARARWRTDPLEPASLVDSSPCSSPISRK